MSGDKFSFAAGNLRKLLAVPGYVLAYLFSFFVPRDPTVWAFGSGIGLGEGSLEVARTLKSSDAEAVVVWFAGSDAEMRQAEAEGFVAVERGSLRGFWLTLRAGQIIVTHGLGDVNRFGIFGGRVVNLIHGAPLKKLHLDSPVTTSVRGPAPLRAILQRMYSAGTKQIPLYVAGSVTAAERLRSAYRVDPGKVRVLGDPRDDALCKQAEDPQAAAHARAQVGALLGLDPTIAGEQWVLYAPTWRDGAPDPAVPSVAEATLILQVLEAQGATLIIRSHPLGMGAYEHLVGPRVRLLGSDLVRDITPLLGAFDAVITDYSSIALDFSLLSRPIVWFAPDLAEYTASRGLYEPLEVTAAGRVQLSWGETVARLQEVLIEGSLAQKIAISDSRALAARFHAHPEGGAAGRVIDEIRRFRLSDAERVAPDSIFFESFYGKQVSCNPLALDREISRRFPETVRYWSVTSERIAVPDGAVPLLVGSPDWFAARRRAKLLIVNDWLRYGFRRAPGQTVLQTWHGTMLKHLALGRPDVGLRTRLAIHRESRRWSLMLSQNPHSTEQFRENYAFRGEIIEAGYPRDDRLADSLAGTHRIQLFQDTARDAIGVPRNTKVIAYVPTWRAHGSTVDLLDVHSLAADLGDEWTVVARGHTRSGASYLAGQQRVVDASSHPDVNDVVLAADVLVTDYSSVMFDASVARVPMMFFVPDLEEYRDRERGFTFNFEAQAPGPIVRTRSEVVEHAKNGVEAGASYDEWRARFNPHDDGGASRRVVDDLVARGAL